MLSVDILRNTFESFLYWFICYSIDAWTRNMCDD